MSEKKVIDMAKIIKDTGVGPEIVVDSGKYQFAYRGPRQGVDSGWHRFADGFVPDGVETKKLPDGTIVWMAKQTSSS